MTALANITLYAQARTHTSGADRVTVLASRGGDFPFELGKRRAPENNRAPGRRAKASGVRFVRGDGSAAVCGLGKRVRVGCRW